jgi:hydrogenase maturation factor
MGDPLATGKLPHDLLASFLKRLPNADPRIIVGPGIGQDAAVIDACSGDATGRYLVVKTDPITFATEEIGAYAVRINANDIACMGAHPKWFLANVLLPAGRADTKMAEAIFRQITEACDGLGIALVGGHTEITHDLARPIVAGTMLGEVEKNRLVTVRGARIGDVVCLTKGIPLEGSALIAREKAEELQTRGFASSFIARAQSLLDRPGISVVREALLAADAGWVSAMHDPTEGGLATGLVELAEGAQVGLEIDEAAIPILPEGRELCYAFGLDPLGVIASGSLLLTTPENHFKPLCEHLELAGIPCTAIGRVVPPEHGLTLSHGGAHRPLPRFPTDEITRLFD